jgi:hypothetical protein
MKNDGCRPSQGAVERRVWNPGQTQIQRRKCKFKTPRDGIINGPRTDDGLATVNDHECGHKFAYAAA